MSARLKHKKREGNGVCFGACMEGYMNTITLIDVIILVLAYVGLSVACMLIRWLIALPYRGDPVQESRERIWRGW
jgi:hypothetical protein